MNNKIFIKSFFIISFFLLFVLSVIYIISGQYDISLNKLFDIILFELGLLHEPTFNQADRFIFFDVRIPRLLLAIVVGGGLAMAGAILQGLFRNPLIDPGFIGVSSGAAVGAIIAMVFSEYFLFYLGSSFHHFTTPIIAILFSFLTTYTIYRISKYGNKTNVITMLLAGIAINALCGSIIGLFISFISDLELRSFTFWTLGGLDSGENWMVVYIVSALVILCTIFIYSIRNKLDIFMLGDEQANHLGVNVESLKIIIILFSAIIVGISVAFCGMIGFIGLVTPHLIRLFIGPKHKYLIPGSILLGSIILVASDLLTRISLLPVGVITSLIGAPFFIFLIIKQKNKIGYAE